MSSKRNRAIANPCWSMRLCAMGLVTKRTVHLHLTDPSEYVKDSPRGLIAGVSESVGSDVTEKSDANVTAMAPRGYTIEGS